VDLLNHGIDAAELLERQLPGVKVTGLGSAVVG